MKADHVSKVKKFQDIPNVGAAVAADFVLIGIRDPKAMKGKDPFVLYQKLCKKTGTRHDPCVLDTFMAVTDFMDGGIAKEWWRYTKERKKKYPDI